MGHLLDFAVRKDARIWLEYRVFNLFLKQYFIKSELVVAAKTGKPPVNSGVTKFFQYVLRDYHYLKIQIRDGMKFVLLQTCLPTLFEQVAESDQKMRNCFTACVAF